MQVLSPMVAGFAPSSRYRTQHMQRYTTLQCSQLLQDCLPWRQSMTAACCRTCSHVTYRGQQDGCLCPGGAAAVLVTDMRKLKAIQIIVVWHWCNCIHSSREHDK